MKIKKYQKRIKICDLILLIIITLLAALVLAVLLYPILYIILASVSNQSIGNSLLLIPKKISFEGYKTLLNNPEIVRGFLNSILYTCVGCSFSTMMTILCAYPLSKKDFFIGKYIGVFFIFTMYFNGGMIPTYLLVKELGLLNTMWSLI